MKLLVMLFVVSSCTWPEEATIEAGGKRRVLCLRPDDRGFVYCRDGHRSLFVCEHSPNSRCVEVRRVQEAWE
jgi:protein tyrosine phosphatase (PTP) superfamily phosphohydrolase (DUF442 family)